MSETPHYWVRTRVTGELVRRGHPECGVVSFILAERDDGAVFYQMVNYKKPGHSEVTIEMIRSFLDRFLNAPKVESSIGTFDDEPNVYDPNLEWGPQRL